jgi:hypothetical protein
MGQTKRSLRKNCDAVLEERFTGIYPYETLARNRVGVLFMPKVMESRI